MPAMHDARRPRYHDDDSDLILRAKNGEDRAFAELWTRHHEFAVRSAVSMTSDFDPEDLASEALARIFQRLRDGGGPDSDFRPYLFVSIRNLAAEWARQRREYTTDDATLFERLEDASPTDDPLDSDATLIEAFRALPARWRETLWYVEVDGMTTAEAADALDLSPNAVHQLTFRAREGLRAAWIQAQLPKVASAPGCRWAVERMGSYERDRLGKRDRAKFEHHVLRCPSCARMVELAEREGARLRVILIPLLLGGALGAPALLVDPQRASAAEAPRVRVARRVGVVARRSSLLLTLAGAAVVLTLSGAGTTMAPATAAFTLALPSAAVPVAAEPTHPDSWAELPADPRVVSTEESTSAPADVAVVPPAGEAGDEPTTPSVVVPAPSVPEEAVPEEAVPPAPPVAGPPYTATFGDKLRYDAQVDKYTIPLTITRSPDADPTTPVTLHLASLEYYSFAGISGQVGTAEPAADGGWTITVPGAASDPQSRTLSVLLQPERETWPGPEWHGDLLCYPLRESIMATIRVLSADGLTAATLSFYDPGVGACEL